MFILAVFAFLSILMIHLQQVSLPPYERQGRDIPEFDRLGGFVYSLDLFRQENAGFQGKLNWSGAGAVAALKDFPLVPSGLRYAGVSDEWWAVFENGSYVLCATVHETTLSHISMKIPREISRHWLEYGDIEFLVFEESGQLERTLSKCTSQ